MVHMLTIKVTSFNYLLWRNQFIPLLTSQDLLGFLDGSVLAPSPQVTDSNGTTQVNPAYTSWLTTDQTLLSLLYSSLTEESMSEVLGLSHAHEAWTTLEASFSHRSKTRELQLKDELQLMQRGSKSVAEFSRLSKRLYDQLAAIDIIPKALSHEIFERSVYQQSINSAFYTQRNNSTRPKSTKSGKPKPSTASASKSSPSFPVYCQICDKEGHLAKQCWMFLNLKKKQSTNLAEAFAACSIPDSNDSEWYPDSSATSHLTNDLECVDVPVVDFGNERVMVGNG
ncbi:hypothetical protein VitviT2T_025199 [Vitis vinifera]|uniref:CCHC-type domain-containing protein n=1 Tax=Vitis vinifera TaxID=29760 RepID=A0ABY9DJW9_VITVI|nr:hypothetical protein VitviT2T_025199 [Vitis vinifera]